MDETTTERPRGAPWWAHLPEGGIRRVWVTKAGGQYFCAFEECTREQESARERLFAGSGSAHDEGRRRSDIAIWSGARFDQLRTHDAQRAYAFLGADEAAWRAMLAADPALADQLKP